MKTETTKVLPHSGYWMAVVFLSGLGVVTHLLMPNGWIMYVFPVLVYVFGRGKQKEIQGLT